MALIEFSVENFVATVCLNRPEKLNAFNSIMVDELTAVIEKLSSENLRMIVLESASEKAFSAGADLNERIDMDDGAVSEFLSRQRKMMDAWAALECPTVAVIEGVAFGGGLELALCCDLRLVSTKSKMGLTETRLAIIPGAGGTQRLSRLIGMSRAKEMIFLAKIIDGNEAYRIGLAQACADNVREVLSEWEETILSSGPLAQKSAKWAIDRGYNVESLDQALVLEREAYDRLIATHDRVEGLRAFKEKRKPKYQGS